MIKAHSKNLIHIDRRMYRYINIYTVHALSYVIRRRDATWLGPVVLVYRTIGVHPFQVIMICDHFASGTCPYRPSLTYLVLVTTVEINGMFVDR